MGLGAFRIHPPKGSIGWRPMISGFKRMAGLGAEALFPGICCCCGLIFRLPSPTHHRPAQVINGRLQSGRDLFGYLLGRHLCEACVDQFQEIQSPLCLRCGEPFASPHGPDHVCGQCQRHPPHFRAARAAGLYTTVLRAVIREYKYKGWSQLFQPLGGLLWITLLKHWDPDQFDRVVPVPLHPRRMRVRGFNQAYLLVRQWPQLAAEYGMDVAHDWVAPRLLFRRRATTPQTGLTKVQRQANLRQAFGITDPEAVRGMQILLVDDVLTTGATVNACARVLMQSGATRVSVLNLARAV